MAEADDITLLREYAERNSEPAFAEIVQRHINLVYSVALRYVGNPPDAQDVTQAVFIILAQKAAGLRHKTALTGWLYETTRFTAMNFLTGKTRRQAREQKAYMESTLNDANAENVWPQLAPLLEEAMTRLNAKERAVVALRFFENKSAAETAIRLGIGEWAAQKRAARAMEKLRQFFLKRGIVSTTATLAGALSANSVHAAPAMLAKTVTVAALAKGATASTSTLTLVKGALKLMAWTKAKMAIITGVAVLLAVGGGTAVYETQLKPAPGAPAELKGQWVAGKKYELHGELNHSEVSKAPGQPQPVQTGYKWTQDMNISALKALPGGGWQLELEFADEALDYSQGGRQVMSFDSTQNKAVNKQDSLTILGAVIGARLEYFTDADGKVQSIEGLDKLTEHVAAVGTPEQREDFNGLFGGDALKSYLSCGDWLPNRMMKPGESWSVKNDVVDSIGTLTVSMRFTFKNREQHDGRECIHISGTGDISSKSVSTASGKMVKIEKGNVAEEFWFDPELGMITGSSETQDMIFKVTTRAQTMTDETHNKAHWTLVEVE